MTAVRIYYNDTRRHISGIIERTSGTALEALADAFPYDWDDFKSFYGPEFADDNGREYQTHDELDEWVSDVHFYSFTCHLSDGLVQTDILKGGKQ